jgi:hypothetical protein
MIKSDGFDFAVFIHRKHVSCKKNMAQFAALFDPFGKLTSTTLSTARDFAG